MGDTTNVTGWINNTSDQVVEEVSTNSWPVDPSNLTALFCGPGWPLGLGIMKGYQTSDNYSIGTFLPPTAPMPACQNSTEGPSDFLIAAFSSSAVVRIGATLQQWDLKASMVFRVQSKGVYTVLVADEWGDLVLIHVKGT